MIIRGPKREGRLRRKIRSAVPSMRLRAALGTFTGLSSIQSRERAYLASCSWRHRPTATAVILTRDTEMHTSGWLKNPDYDQCLHLSLRTIAGMEPPAPRPWLNQMWAEEVFGKHAPLTWAESAKSEIGKQIGVVHYRLFCDNEWRPILPRGEVYSRDWTPPGWQSWSDLHEQGGPEVVSSLHPG